MLNFPDYFNDSIAVFKGFVIKFHTKAWSFQWSDNLIPMRNSSELPNFFHLAVSPAKYLSPVTLSLAASRPSTASVNSFTRSS